MGSTRACARSSKKGVCSASRAKPEWEPAAPWRARSSRPSASPSFFSASAEPNKKPAPFRAMRVGRQGRPAVRDDKHPDIAIGRRTRIPLNEPWPKRSRRLHQPVAIYSGDDDWDLAPTRAIRNKAIDLRLADHRQKRRYCTSENQALSERRVCPVFAVLPRWHPRRHPSTRPLGLCRLYGQKRAVDRLGTVTPRGCDRSLGRAHRPALPSPASGWEARGCRSRG